MMAAFDDQERLFVGASSGVNLSAPDLYKQFPHANRMLEDTDADGTLDKATTFADNMTFPQGAPWHDNAIYVASPLSIWKLEDTTGVDSDGILRIATNLLEAPAETVALIYSKRWVTGTFFRFSNMFWGVATC